MTFLSRTTPVSRALAALALALAIVLAAPRASADPPPDALLGLGAFGAESAGGAGGSTGAALARHPLAFPPARGLPQPILGLSYAHTNTAMSEVGVGWSLGLPVIERRGRAGGPPIFASTDVYYLSGAPLVWLGTISGSATYAGVKMPSWSANWNLLRPAVDASNTRVFQHSDGKTYRVMSSNGVVLELGWPRMLPGATPDPGAGIDEVRYPEPPPGVPYEKFRWKLVRQFDAYATGSSPANIIVYGWERSTADDISRLAEIYYTPPAVGGPDNVDTYAHHIHFEYHPAWFDSRQKHVRIPPWLNRPDRLVSRIDVATKGVQPAREQVRRYHLGYGNIAARPHLISVVLEGRCDLPTYEVPQPDGRKVLSDFPCPRYEPGTIYEYAQGGFLAGTGGGTWYGARPPIKIKFRLEGSSVSPPIPNLDTTQMAVVDVDRNGLVDIVSMNTGTNGEARVYLNDGNFLGETGNERTFTVRSLSVSGGVSPFSSLGLSAFGALGDSWQATWLHRPPSPGPNIADGAPNAVLRIGPSGTTFSLGSPGGAPPIVARPPPHLLGDIDGDGTPDLLALDETDGNKTKVFLSRRELTGASPRFGYTAPFAVPMLGETPPLGAGVSNLQLRKGENAPHFAALADVDGDGIADYVTDRGPGHRGNAMYIPGRGNGDFGCTDSFNVPPSEKMCTPALADAGYHASGPPSLSELFVDVEAAPLPGPRLNFHDVTGEGAAEVIWVTLAAAGQPTIAHVAFNTTGVPQTAAQEFVFPFPDFDFSGPALPKVLFGDIDGNGIDDLIVCGTNECGYLSFHDTKPGLLTRITHESGATTDFEYHRALADMEAYQAQPPLNPFPDTGAWTSHAPANPWPVKSITRRNHAPAPYTIESREELDYRDPVYDRWRGSLQGFRRVRSTNWHLATETRFYFEGCLVEDAAAQASGCGGAADPANPETIGKFDALNGQPISVERYNVNTHAYHSTTAYKYAYANGGATGVGFMYPSEVYTLVYDTAAFGGPTSSMEIYTPMETTYSVPIRGAHDVLRRRQSLNEHGKIVDAWDDGRVGPAPAFAPIDRPIRRIYDWQTTEAVFTTAVGALGREYLLRSVETKYDPGGAGSLLTAADGLDGPSRKVDHTYDSLGRMLTAKSVVLGAQPLQRSHAGGGATATAPGPGNGTYAALVTLTYDAFGNVATRKNAVGNCQTFDYDLQFADYPRATHVWTGTDCGAGLDLSSSVQLERGLAVPVKRTAVNGAESGTAFDNFGRPRSTWVKPSQGTPSDVMQFEYVPAGGTIKWVHATRLASDPAKVSHTWAFSDTFGNAMATLTTADTAALDGGDFVVHAAPARELYSGRPVTWFKPWFHQGAAETYAVGSIGGAPTRQVVYDFMSRPLQIFRLSDGHEISRTEYHGLWTAHWDAENIQGASNHLDMVSRAFVDGHGRRIRAEKVTETGTIATVTDYVATGELAALERRGAGGETLYRRWLRYDSRGLVVENAEPNSTLNFATPPARPRE